MEARSLGDPDLALAALRAARAPDADAPTLRLAASLLLELGRSEEAERLLGDLIAADPHEAAARADRGVLRSLLGREEEAASDLEAAIGLAPEEPAAYLSLGALHERNGRPGDAREVYARGLSAARPQDPAMLLELRQGLKRVTLPAPGTDG
jgi:tetratricopeptide (TPR) repeat protein